MPSLPDSHGESNDSGDSPTGAGADGVIQAVTASQLATLLHARRTGKGRWSARCPSHADRHPSLQIAEGKKGILLRCMSHGCDTRDVLGALGLSFSDLFYSQRTMTPEIKRRIGNEEQMENLLHLLGLAVWLGAQGDRHWAVVEKNLKASIMTLRCEMEPLEVYREWRGKQWQVMNRTQREAVLEEAWQRLNR